MIFSIGKLHVFCKQYNGFAIGLRAEDVIELTGFDEGLENIEVDKATCWVIILPLFEIYMTIR